MQPGVSLRDLTASLAERTRSYLAGEMSIDTLAFQDAGADDLAAMLGEHTVIFGVAGSYGLLALFSFCDELGDRLVQGAGGHDGSHDGGRHAILARAATVILGRWLAEIGTSGALTLSPPVILKGAQTMHLQDQTICTGASLVTDAGSLDIRLMGRAEPVLPR